MFSAFTPFSDKLGPLVNGPGWRWNWASDPEGLALASLASQESRDAGAWAVTRVAALGRAEERRKAQEAEQRQREQLAAFRQQQLELAPGRQQSLPPHAVWVAWHYARGETQKVIGEQLGVSNATICILVRRYIEAWLPEALALAPPSWGWGHYAPLIVGNSRELLRDHFGDRPEPEPAGPAWDKMCEKAAVLAAIAAAARERAWYRGRRNLGRPLDMGGPRDCWVEYSLESQSA